VGQTQMPDKDNAPAFWTSIANAFKGNPAVIFELFNEPYGLNSYPIAASDWQMLRDGGTYPSFVRQNPLTGGLQTTAFSWQAAGMQTLLNAVRATGATNVVLVGTLGWSGELSHWLAYKPSDPLSQMAAAWHAYPWSTDPSKPAWTPAGDQYSFAAAIEALFPVVITETANNPLGQQLYPWADRTGTSYIAWAWNPWSSRWLISDANGTPTAYGAYYKAHLACVAAGTSNCP
jgi:hypothetical protein